MQIKCYWVFFIKNFFTNIHLFCSLTNIFKPSEPIVVGAYLGGVLLPSGLIVSPSQVGGGGRGNHQNYVSVVAKFMTATCKKRTVREAASNTLGSYVEVRKGAFAFVKRACTHSWKREIFQLSIEVERSWFALAKERRSVTTSMLYQLTISSHAFRLIKWMIFVRCYLRV